MKEIEIFKLENRILFEAAAAAEIVAAADMAQDNADAGANGQQNDEENTLACVPAGTNDFQRGSVCTDPAKLSDVDAEINALINGILPMAQESRTDISSAGDLETFTSDDNGSSISADGNFARSDDFAPVQLNESSIEITVSDAAELENALDTAFGNGGNYTITITQDITVDSELYYYFDQDLNLTIQGSSDDISLSTDDGTGILFFDADYDVDVNIVIDNLDFAGQGSESALYIYDADSLTVNNSRFSDFGSGAVYYRSEDGTLTVANTEFLNNSTSGDGAAIQADEVDVQISNSYFAGNTADGYGGALAIQSSDNISITDTSFYDNSAHEGGAVYIDDSNGTLNISNATFYDNRADNLGGAIAFAGSGANGNFNIADTTFADNKLTSADGVGEAIYNDTGSLAVKNTLLIGNTSKDVLHQELGGETVLDHTFATSVGGNGTVSMGEGAKVDSTLTSAAVFGNNTYDDAEKHTIAVDAFHEAAWSGIKISDYDQNGGSREAINNTIGLTGRYTIGAVTAETGLNVVQNDYSTPYTGMDITPEEHLTLSYADGTVLAMTVTAALTADPAPVKDIGTYTITPSNASVAEIPADSKVVYAYTAGTLTVHDWGNAVIQENNFTYTYSDDMPLQSVYTFEADDWRTADPTDKVTITVNVQWQIIDGKVTYSSSGNVNVSPYADSLAVKSFTAVDENGNDMIPFYTWVTDTVSDLTVEARTLNVTIDGALFNKVYDGTTATEDSDNNYSADMVAGDDVTVSGIYSYDNKNVGDDKVVTFSELTLSGVDAGNYILAATEVSDNNAVVTARTLTVTIDGTLFNKVYDGTTATEDSDNNYSTDMVAGDDVTVSGIYSYDNKNVGDDKVVTFSELTLSGADAGNYILAATEVSDNNAVVTARMLDVSVILPTDKVYDGTDNVSSQASLNDVIANDDVAITAEWKYNSSDVISADTINNIIWQLSGDDAANYALPDVAVYDNIDAVITPKDVQVSFETDSPYYYTGKDQSDTVSASYIDINGNKIDADINWNGQEFIDAGAYLVTAEGSDTNYNLVDNTMTIVMNPALIQPSFTVYSDGTNPMYSSSIISLQGVITANKTADGNISTYPWAQLITEALLDKKGIVSEAYGTEFFGGRVTVDTLKYRPFELDAVVKELSLTIACGNDPQGIALGEELFIDGNYSSTDHMQLFEQRGDTLSEYHDPLYVEKDYTADQAVNYDIPAIDIQQNKVSNLKTDLEKLLDELTFTA